MKKVYPQLFVDQPGEQNSLESERNNLRELLALDRRQSECSANTDGKSLNLGQASSAHSSSIESPFAFGLTGASPMKVSNLLDGQNRTK